MVNWAWVDGVREGMGGKMVGLGAAVASWY